MTLTAAPGFASGFSVARFAGEQGHPTADNPSVLYYDPAALRSERPQLMLDGLFGRRQLTYTRPRAPSDAPDASDAPRANAGRATLANWLVSPSIWLTLPISNWVLAAGVFTPFGGPVSWDERGDFEGSSHPGPIDGVARFHSIEGVSITTYGALGAAYAVGDSGLRLGAAFNLMYSFVQDLRGWSGGSNDVSGEGRSLLEASGWAAGFGAGVYYRASKSPLALGVSYQSRPNVAGGMKLHGKLSNDIGGPSSADVDLHEDLPDIVRLGLSYRLERALELRLFGTWERWSAFERQCVSQAGANCDVLADGSQPEGGKVLQNLVRDFHDAFEVRAGVSGWVRPELELFSGVGVMTSAVPRETLDPSLPDFFGISFALGANYRVSRALSLGSSYTQIVAAPRDSQARFSRAALPTRQPDAVGHYAQSVGFLDVNVTVRF